MEGEEKRQREGSKEGRGGDKEGGGEKRVKDRRGEED